MRTAIRQGWGRVRAAAARLVAGPPLALVRAHPVRTTMLVIVTCCITALGWARTCGFRTCPSLVQIREYRPGDGGRVLDRQGRILGHLHPVRRIVVPLSQVPRAVQQAFIAVEDRRFFEHDGIDWRGAGRAFMVNLRHAELRQGSSTITMQAARSAFLDRYEGERSLRRKLIELHLAGRLETALSKPQILELYLNTIYLGDGTYGVEAASRHYFGKPVRQLTLAEAALLAALPRAPSVYDPRRAPQRARDRRDLVLSLMAEQRFIAVPVAVQAQAEPLRVAREGWRPDGGPSDALDLVRAVVDSLSSARAWEARDLVVQTTFDLDAQRAAGQAVRDRAAAITRAQHGARRVVQGAMAALDPETGEMRAVVGAAVGAPGGMNRAVSAHRQPGSAFKPFVYAAALERGYTPSTLVDDSPVRVVQQGRSWQPENYGGQYRGTVTLGEALLHSLNAATVRVSQEVGIDRVIAAARRTGITSPLPSLPSLALGSAEMTPLELVRAYAAFGNGGWRVTPGFLVRISTREGTVLWQRPTPERVRALDPRDAFLLTTMLQDVVDEGTGAALRTYGVDVPAAGKTGTSNDGTDVWFVGYTRTLVAGFWFGYDAPESLGPGATGGRLAAPAWAAFYRHGWDATQDAAGWDVPEGIERRGGERECRFFGLFGCTMSPPRWSRTDAPEEEHVREEREDAPRPPFSDERDDAVPTARRIEAEIRDAREQVRTQLQARIAERADADAEVRRALHQALQEVRRAARDARRQAAQERNEP